MFIDEVVIKVEAGNGGDGCLAFRREKYVAMGGPFGGNGGHGSNIIFKVDEGLHTLIDLRYMKTIKGKKGENGRGKNQNGAAAEDVIIKVPQGTIVTDLGTGFIIADLKEKDDEVVVAYGGRGGRGNTAFKTQSNPAPNFAENGEPGEVKELKVELKLLADVGLVGMPSVGKSTIISCVSKAKPKIAAYHFTTLNPNLGVARTKDGRSFVIADLPGLIEGASLGEGLGDRFLKHIERTRLLLHVIDITGSEGRIPVEDFKLINNELKKYSQKLASKKQIVVANKMDSLSDEGYLKDLEMLCKKEGLKLFKISAATKIGLDDLLNYVSEELKKIPKEDIVEVIKEDDDELVDQEWHVEKKNDTYYVTGAPIERLMSKVNIFDVESRQYMQRVLNKMGVMDKARELGLQDGEYLDIIGYQMEYND